MKIQNLLTLASTAVLIANASAVVTIDYITVANPNNAADTTGYGSVAYNYEIGKYEVSNAQYAAFLNAVDPTGSNPNGIYNTSMGTHYTGGIAFNSGASAGAKYTIRSNYGDMTNRPVNFVSWFDAARFSNWMHNGQGAGSTETGAYTLSGNTGIVTKNVGATIYIPSENEWYKAAYYNGTNSSYSPYANGQSSITTADANYGWAIEQVTVVGSYTNDPSSYGTFDQGGNVSEWNDAVISGTLRGIRGGSFSSGFYNDSSPLLSSARSSAAPTNENESTGFRVASVPEPSAMVLTVLASGMMLIRRKR